MEMIKLNEILCTALSSQLPSYANCLDVPPSRAAHIRPQQRVHHEHGRVVLFPATRAGDF